MAQARRQAQITYMKIPQAIEDRSPLNSLEWPFTVVKVGDGCLITVNCSKFCIIESVFSELS